MTQVSDVANKSVGYQVNNQRLHNLIRASPAGRGRIYMNERTSNMFIAIDFIRDQHISEFISKAIGTVEILRRDLFLALR